MLDACGWLFQDSRIPRCGIQPTKLNVDPVKRKVISELFFAPSVLLPIVGGISAGMLSWALDGNGGLTLAAGLGVLGGLGWMMTRIIFQIESITEDAMRFEQEQAL